MSMTKREKMIGNKNGSGNKGRKFKPETIEKMRLAKVGKPSDRKGSKNSLETREKIKKSLYLYNTNKNPSYIPFTYDDRKKRRRERIKMYGGFHSLGEWETLKAQYDFTCPSCHQQEPKIKLTRDHIIPIAKGGSDNIENIQPLCVKCNSRKSTTTIRY